MGGGAGDNSVGSTPDPDKSISDLSSIVADYGVGIDCHSRFIQICVLSRCVDSTIVRRERRYSTTWEGLCEAREWVLETLSQTIAERAPSENTLTYCVESTAAYHYPVTLAWGGYPCVVNPLLARAGLRKTDRLDAMMLARQAITGTWKPSYTAPVEIEACRLAMNHRRRLLQERARLSNSMNNLVLRFGHTFAAHVRGDEQGVGTPLYSPAVLPIFEALSEGMLPNFRGISPHRIPEDVQQVMSACVGRISELNQAISRQDHRLISLVGRTEFTTRRGELIKGKLVIEKLRTVPGVGPLCAAAWLVQVGDVGRFVHPKQVTAFCGFDPSLMVSAGKVTAHSRRKGHIFLHYMIKQAAKGVLNRHNEPLGLWGHQMSKRHKAGGYSKAVGAVGRKIATAMWVCHRDLVDFSYDSYEFWRAPDVPDVAIQEVGFSPQTVRVLVAHGFATTAALVNAYTTGELAQRKGVGAKCLAHLNRWITENKRQKGQASTSAAVSSGGESASSEKTKRKSSPTASCSTTPSSTSTIGVPPRTSRSATRSKSP